MVVPAVLCIGEVLFDDFADGTRQLGGAPLNVAARLQRSGTAALVISRVGSDEPARQMLKFLQDEGLSTRGVQFDSDRPTGHVQVFDNRSSGPAYEIVPDQAWDAISPRIDPSLWRHSTPWLYHGTLALRCGTSRATILGLREAISGSNFVDLNLREPWWSADTIRTCCVGANVIKTNEEELRHALTSFGVSTPKALGEQALRLVRATGTTEVLVTRGAEGALAADAAGEVLLSEAAAIDVVDTVGAGDAFSAGYLYATLAGEARRQRLNIAVEWSRQACTVRGALGVSSNSH